MNNRLALESKAPAKNSDGWIHAKVEMSLLFHRNVSSINTETTVKNGIVVLKGKADNLAQKDLVTQYVKDIDGVQGVVNEMTVVNSASPTPCQNGEWHCEYQRKSGEFG